MNADEILIQEYNNLWNEKLIHKEGIRKFHNYLTYITAIGSLVLAFNGLSLQDVINAVTDPAKAAILKANAENIINIFFVAFTPVLLLTITFPLNDVFHIFAIGNHLGNIEKKINLLTGNKLLSWEHGVCPKVYGGEKDHEGNRVENVISLGDSLILIPCLFLMAGFSTWHGACFMYEKIGIGYLIAYLTLIVYMLGIIIALALKIRSYTLPKGPLNTVIRNVHKTCSIQVEKKIICP
ncbi:MAG: hypothetical protein D3914_08455 [Candidatus Electrothrix sp. LOE2]|nr:hypothetical protein [Candidatus Electrothrix sp. LOE2]